MSDTWHMHAHNTTVPEASALNAQFVAVDMPKGQIGAGLSHNPTVCVHGDRLVINVRVSHERHTRNFMGYLGSDWKPYSMREIHNEWYDSGHGIMDGTVGGVGRLEIEDLRIFSWLGGLWCVAAIHEGGHNPQHIRQGLVEIIDRNGLRFARPYAQYSDRVEKNWMPCVVDGSSLRFVYSANPLRVLHTDVGTMTMRPDATSVPKCTSHMRGGSQLVPFEDGYLALVHQVYKPPRMPPDFNPLMSDFWPPIPKHPVSGSAPLVYLHQFVKFNADLTHMHTGKHFFFRQASIEFSCGLAFWEGKFVAGLGFEEREAWIAVIEPDVVRRLLY